MKNEPSNSEAASTGPDSPSAKLKNLQARLETRALSHLSGVASEISQTLGQFQDALAQMKVNAETRDRSLLGEVEAIATKNSDDSAPSCGRCASAAKSDSRPVLADETSSLVSSIRKLVEVDLPAHLQQQEAQFQRQKPFWSRPHERNPKGLLRITRAFVRVCRRKLSGLAICLSLLVVVVTVGILCRASPTLTGASTANNWPPQVEIAQSTRLAVRVEVEELQKQLSEARANLTELERQSKGNREALGGTISELRRQLIDMQEAQSMSSLLTCRRARNGAIQVEVDETAPIEVADPNGGKFEVRRWMNAKMKRQ